MNIFGLEIGWARKSYSVSIDVLRRIDQEHYQISSGIAVNPDLAMQSPTVQAIVQAVSRRISTLPVQVLKKTVVNGRTRKEPQPDHPVAMLLAKPNDMNDRVQFWLDATSWLVRYGNYYAWLARGGTGPVRRLEPFHPGKVTIKRDLSQTFGATYTVTFANGEHGEFLPSQILHARGPSRDGFKGDSPVMDVREAIGLEIAAERFGASYFGGSATPGLVFQYAPGGQPFKTAEEEAQFVKDIQAVYANRGRFKSMLLPKGIELGDPITIDNDKAQFLGLRQLQRTIIAGAFGVPPHLVGDLSKGTFNNVEQQSLAFVSNVVQPYVTVFEAAMERSLLTDAERAEGICIRFNIDAALRADFKTRQEGLNIQRQAGVLSPNEWREHEGMNPREGGDSYLEGGSSGQAPTGKPPDEKPKPTDEPADDDDDDGDEDEQD